MTETRRDPGASLAKKPVVAIQQLQHGSHEPIMAIHTDSHPTRGRFGNARCDGPASSRRPRGSLPWSPLHLYPLRLTMFQLQTLRPEPFGEIELPVGVLFGDDPDD